MSWIRRPAATALASALACLPGCAQVAEVRQLEERVRRVEVTQAQPEEDPTGELRERVAALAAEVSALRGELRTLHGRIEVAEHESRQALDQARRARGEAALAGSEAAAGPAEGASGEDAIDDRGAPADELAAYRAAFELRRGEPQACIDRFRDFLQSYASSVYADEAAYWMADCYFRMGDYKAAVLRFDDVVAGYPDGNKAPDALYRQGEALLRLGPNFSTAAGKAFERVIDEYGDSPRAEQARRQLEVLRVR